MAPFFLLPLLCCCSHFEDVFDVQHFISSLRNDVPVVTRLPHHLERSEVQKLHLRSWSNATYYTNVIAQHWDKYKASALPYGSFQETMMQDTLHCRRSLEAHSLSCQD